MNKMIGNYSGKKIIRYDPNINCSENDLNSFLSKFKLYEALRLVGERSYDTLKYPNHLYNLNDVPISGDILIELAYCLILASTDDNNKIMNDDDLALACRMLRYLFDKQMKDKSLLEILIKHSFSQFRFQYSLKYTVCRAIFLFNILWPSIKRARDINIENDLQELIGLNFETIILLCFSFSGAGPGRGFFRCYDNFCIEKLPLEAQICFSKENQEKFLKAFSADYDYFRNTDALINPLFLFPIINTKAKPVPDLPEVFIIPSYYTLTERVTAGLYYIFSDKYHCDKCNAFRTAFGYVFQEYIGVLLREHLTHWTIHPEIRYGKCNDTVDYLVQKDDRLILIEVKQSSLFLISKIQGDINNIKIDIQKTICRGISQLINTENAIKSNKYHELSIFQDAKHIERIIVLYDPLPFANSKILKDIIQGLIPDYPHNYNFHVINIPEFENLLALQKESESIFDLLAFKSINEECKEMDFDAYLIRSFPEEKEFRIPILDDIYKNFFSQFNQIIKHIDPNTKKS